MSNQKIENPKFANCRRNVGEDPTSGGFLAWVAARGAEYAAETGDETPAPNALFTAEPAPQFEAWLERNAGRPGWDKADGDGAKQYNLLIEVNMGLAFVEANKMARPGADVNDLVQEGCIGLHSTAHQFDWRRGTRFSTYAVYHIRQRIGRFLDNHSRTIRVPCNVLLDARRDPKGKQAKAAAVGNTISLDAPVKGDEDGASLIDFVISPYGSDVAEAVACIIDAENLSESMSRLTDGERRVLDLRFGLTEDQSLTLDEIGKMMGVTRERVRQVEAKALRKLRMTIPARKDKAA